MLLASRFLSRFFVVVVVYIKGTPEKQSLKKLINSKPIIIIFQQSQSNKRKQITLYCNILDRSNKS